MARALRPDVIIFLGDLIDGARRSPSHSHFRAALEATQGQIDGVFSQLPYKCYLEEVAFVGD